jgi:hypothetical protein
MEKERRDKKKRSVKKRSTYLFEIGFNSLADESETSGHHN